MIYNEKKSLYERIMREIAKTVKSHINETEIANKQETNKHSFNNQPMLPNDKELPKNLSSQSSRNFVKQYGNHRLTDNNTKFDYQELEKIYKCLDALLSIFYRFENNEHPWIKSFFNRLAKKGITQEFVVQIRNIVDKHLKKDKTVADHFNRSM